MKWFPPILFVSILLITIGCRKDLSAFQPLLVKDIIIDSNSCEIYFNYDNQNRLLSVTQCDTTKNYTYNGDTVSEIHLISGSVSGKIVYLLDQTGLASSYILTRQDGTVAFYILHYDAQGHRIAATDRSDSGTAENITYFNGDAMTDISSSTVSESDIFDINTTYYPNTINRLGNINFGLAFLGTSSAEYKKGDYIQNPFVQYTINYTYLLNNQNGVQMRESTINGVVTDKRYYDYY